MCPSPRKWQDKSRKRDTAVKGNNVSKLSGIIVMPIRKVMAVKNAEQANKCGAAKKCSASFDNQR
jgi:hypothetical protein